MRNETISLGRIPSIGTETVECQLNLIKSENVVTPHFVSLSKKEQIMLHCFAWINAAVFTYFRLIVIKYLYKQFKMKEVTSVNILTMIIYLFQHLEVFWYITQQVMMLWVGNDYSEIIPPWYCSLNSNILLFMYIYSVLGGLGVATYRIMLIKHQVLVKDIIGRKRLMFIILSFEFFISMCLIGSFHINDTFWDPVQPPCMYRVPGNVLEFLDTYRQSIGHQSFLSYHNMNRISLLTVNLALTLSEVIIYVIFFHHIYKQDNTETLKKLLGNEVINERNRKNVMSFMSLFFSFLVESFFLIILYLSSNSETKETLFKYPFFVRNISLTAIAAVEVATSNVLRPIMLQKKEM